MLLSVRSARRAAAGAAAAGCLAGAMLFGPIPSAQAAPPPPPAHCTVEPSCTAVKAPGGVTPQQPPNAVGWGTRALAVRLPIRLGLLSLRLGRLAWRL